MSHIVYRHVVIQMYCPPGVHRVLGKGSSAFVGYVDDATVLKYPLDMGADSFHLEHEKRLLDIVGRHEGIIAHKGLTDQGLYLERACNGSLLDFMGQVEPSSLSVQQRIAWCRQIIEAVEYVHSKRVFHCDINPKNILLDERLRIKLCDFQGSYRDEEGKVILRALAGAPDRYCLREFEGEATVQTELFAFGSTIHFIMTGEEIFPEICPLDDNYPEEILLRFESGVFPQDVHACTEIAQKCWNQQYSSAHEVWEDIVAVERLHTPSFRNNVDKGKSMGVARWTCVIL
ncbi:hypothetical protein E4U42_002668 [Claviceps africana]|uniref:Protein kinase domain-containing protein n=1 Tax=Claviceps africana TaxID=83212 RepID=A0A8K0J8D0_9HYPO|nr:hypothetical protein E4U42_002668 [Claviceps africana]